MTTAALRPVLTDDSVARLPRWALLGICILYAVPGFIGHEPWKGPEALAFGRALDALQGASLPADLGTALGAASMAAFGRLLGLPDAFRLPSLLLLWLTFALLWYACYHFARRDDVQPAALPFGGQPHPVAYARAVADGSLLGMIACLGLADVGHTGIPEVGQMACVALLLYAGAAAGEHRMRSLMLAPAALILLSLFGAPRIALLLGATLSLGLIARRRQQAMAAALLCATVLCAALWLRLGRSSHPAVEPDVAGLLRLAVWFWWPLWLVVGYGLWVRRRHWLQPEVVVPLVILLCIAAGAALLNARDTTLLLSLPPLTLLAATSLPYLTRTALAAIDWFAVALFTALAAFLWVLWIASQTGWPRTIAGNIERFYPGFRDAGAWPFQAWAFAAALALTAAWFALVVWRTSRQRKPLWKGMVLTAGGVTLTWGLLQTLGAPMLQSSRSYASVARAVAAQVPAGACILPVNVQDSQLVLLRYLGGLRWAAPAEPCRYALVQTVRNADATAPLPPDGAWRLLWSGRRPADRTETFSLFMRDGGALR